MKLWKRNAVVAAIVLFVCAAVYLNWSYSQEGMSASEDTGKVLGEAALVGAQTSDPLLEGTPSPTATPSAEEGSTSGTSSSYFDSARLNRQQARDSALSLLQEAAADADAGEEAVAQANEAIQAMAAYTIAEANIENGHRQGLYRLCGLPQRGQHQRGGLQQRHRPHRDRHRQDQ